MVIVCPGLNALRADKPAQLHQLVSELANVLQITPEPVASYQRYVDAISKLVPDSDANETRDHVALDNSTSNFRRTSSHDDNTVAAGLSRESRELLQEAGRDRNGFVLVLEHLGGMSIETNERNFVEQGNPRSEAKWRRAVRELDASGLLEATDSGGETFRLTDLGYRVLDEIETAGPTA